MTECDFTNHEGMRQNRRRIEQICERSVFGSQMIDPDRRIDKYHAREGLRRGAAFNFELAATEPREPPGALAFDQRLESFMHKARFFLSPVKACAWPTSASSRAIVVRMRASCGAR